jgi:methionyl-tRNA formyltransferase
MPFRIAFLGTGEFALPSFRAIANSANTVVGLVTQPDRTDSRGRVHPNVMKEFAVERGIPVLQPTNINTAESLAELRALGADLFMVAAYGQILSADVIQVPPRGAYNLHGSLLPKYRGAAPIQYAVWKGERETGVTIFKIEPQLDAGLMLATISTEIGRAETAGELETRLADLVVPTTLQFLEDLEQGRLTGMQQDKSQVTKAPKLKKEFGAIDWSLTAAEIDCQVRAMQPWPQPYGFLKVEGKPPLRVLILSVTGEGRATSDEQQDPVGGFGQSPTGTVVRSDGKSLAIRCGDGLCRIEKIQPVGKRPMPIADFLRGNPVPVGSRIDRLEADSPTSDPPATQP